MFPLTIFAFSLDGTIARCPLLGARKVSRVDGLPGSSGCLIGGLENPTSISYKIEKLF